MQQTTDPAVITFLIILTIWVIIWRDIALWHAAKYNQKRWFIALTALIFPIFFLNALGLVDIAYLFFFAKKKLTLTEMKGWFDKKDKNHD